MKAHWFYYLVKFTGWIGLKLFFGGVKIVGKDRIPKDGALLFTPNHQGAFMDAVLVGVFSKRPVSFLTRADVFTRLSTPILRSLNMMAIYRIRDGFGNLSQNDAVFDTCFKMLSEQKSILIFPEGNHNAEYFLRGLSKGTSRLALDARANMDPQTKLYIIPTGINYFSHRRPFAKVIINFGSPVDLNDYMELYHQHKQKGYNKLKEDLSEFLKSTMILPEESSDYSERKKWVFQPKHEHLSFDELKNLAKQKSFEERQIKPIGGFRRALIGFFGLFNLLPLLGLKKVLSGVKDLAFYGSMKYLVGGILHLIWWAIVYTIGAVWIGWEAGLLFMATAIVCMYARQSLIKY